MVFKKKVTHINNPTQGRGQNLKVVPQNFTEFFSIDDVTPNDLIQRNQHCKEKKLEFHSNH